MYFKIIASGKKYTFNCFLKLYMIEKFMKANFPEVKFSDKV